MSTMTVGLPLAQDTEVTAKATRRRFTAADKLRVLQEADGFISKGQVTEILEVPDSN